MNENLNKEEQILIGNDEIFYKDIAYFLKRNAKKLFTFLSISISISLIYTLKLKNVWQGEFQIVLDDEESQINKLAQFTGNRNNFNLDQ